MPHEPIKVGNKAPAFTLADAEGNKHKLSDYLGAPVVLYFYPKDDTSGCTKEAIAFTQHRKAFDDIGVTIVGVSADSVKAHDKFKAKHDLDITLASDEEKSMLEAYGVWVEKSMYGRKYMGIERSTFLIDGDGKVAKAWRKVKVPGHVEAVLEAAKTL